MNKNNDFEIGIIGGGPSGSTAALYLAEYGFNVALFEKRKFPRETLCGEFLSSEVIHHLKKLNLFEEFLSLNPNKINSFSFFNSYGKKLSSDFSFTAYGLTRSSFDNLLLCNAKRRGVNIFQPAEVKEIKNLKKYYEILIKDNKGELSYLKFKFLISAYGKQNPLDNFLERDFINYKSKLNGIKFHLNKKALKSFNEDEIQIYAADNIYCGVNAVDKDLITFCFLEDRNENQPPPREQLERLKKNNKFFEGLFYKNSGNLFENIPVHGTGNIYFGKRKVVEDGIFMIGDSASVIAPLAGDGIGIAMESAKLIADLFFEKKDLIISSKQIDEESIVDLQKLYTKRWKNLFNKRIRTAGFIQKAILKKITRNSGIYLIKTFPSFLSYLIKSTRNISDYN